MGLFGFGKKADSNKYEGIDFSYTSTGSGVLSDELEDFVEDLGNAVKKSDTKTANKLAHTFVANTIGNELADLLEKKLKAGFGKWLCINVGPVLAAMRGSASRMILESEYFYKLLSRQGLIGGLAVPSLLFEAILKEDLLSAEDEKYIKWDNAAIWKDETYKLNGNEPWEEAIARVVKIIRRDKRDFYNGLNK